MTHDVPGLPDWAATAAVEECAERDDHLARRVGHAAVARELALTPGETLLDVGCGPGAIACWFAEDFGVYVIAADVSPQMLDRAERENSHERVDYRLIEPPGLPLSMDELVDAAMANFVFNTVADPAVAGAIVESVARQLKPGARFVILAPGPPDGADFDGFRRGDPGVIYQPGDTYPMYVRHQDGAWAKLGNVYWPESAYREWLTVAGFTSIEVKRPAIAEFLSPDEVEALTGAERATPPFSVVTARLAEPD